MNALHYAMTSARRGLRNTRLALGSVAVATLGAWGTTDENRTDHGQSGTNRTVGAATDSPERDGLSAADPQTHAVLDQLVLKAASRSKREVRRKHGGRRRWRLQLTSPSSNSRWRPGRAQALIKQLPHEAIASLARVLAGRLHNGTARSRFDHWMLGEATTGCR